MPTPFFKVLFQLLRTLNSYGTILSKSSMSEKRILTLFTQVKSLKIKGLFPSLNTNTRKQPVEENLKIIKNLRKI